MPTEPHVLHVLSSAGLYGAEHAVLSLIQALAEVGFQSTLACIDNPHQDEQPLYQRARTLGISAERVPCRGRLDSATTRAIRALLQRHPDAILHVHGYKGAFYALRARSTQPDTPIVATLHGWINSTRTLWLYRMLELWMLRQVQCICIVAENMRPPLRNAGIPATRIRLIENGIDTTRFLADGHALARGELGIPDCAFVFGSVLRMSAEKNPLGLLEAFSRIAADAPQAWLVLAGDGPQRGEFEHRARASGVSSRIRLLGTRNDPERIFPLFDCFTLPSLSEGLPLALLEAMACERPVIASRVGQIVSVLEGLPAKLVPAGDVDSLSCAMRLALNTRPPVTAMRQRVLARFSVIRMAHDYASVYRQLENRHVDKAA